MNTDWLAKPLHMGTGQKHSLSIELGGRDLRVMTTFSYNHIVGVMKGSTRDTYDGSLQVSIVTKIQFPEHIECYV